ncbi:MAG: GspE/PulE family protein [Candidatus Gribaldobacteria bacterium]|nr:GspE/PulE family protein [Candidatus Gribaldobacteria bacterium]
MDIYQFLIKKKFFTKEEAIVWQKEVTEKGKTLEELMTAKDATKEAEFFRWKAEALGIPLRKDLPENIPHEVLSIIPRESADFYKITPLGIERNNNILVVGMVYPENQQAQEALKFLVRQQKLSPQIYLITLSDFKKVFGKYQTAEKEVKQALATLKEEDDLSSEEKESSANNKGDFNRLVEEAPTIKIVSVILRQAVEGDASDIHIEPGRDQLRVRYRLDGVLYSSLILPKSVHAAVVGRIKILSRLKIDETRLPQDGRFSIKVEQKLVDFRVSTLPTSLGEKVVLRVLDASSGIKKLSDLGLAGHNLTLMEKAITLPYKMILVTGPTGSGKTTTLYSMLRLVNNEEVNIVTLEDPIEYFMAGVNQSQVNADIGYTFVNGLRQILRQDPDIIMVGEIRDEETANLGVQAALTGHLVFSTLHTNSAVGAIARLIDMNIKPFLIPASLNTVLAQRLVRILCPFCKKKIALSGELRKYVSEKIEPLPIAEKERSAKAIEEMTVFQAVGCVKCNNSGYSGRIGIFESLEIDDDLAELILNKSGEREIFAVARKKGMFTMEEDGIIKALEGITSLEEVIRTTTEN